jgi:hypothetical protein
MRIICCDELLTTTSNRSNRSNKSIVQSSNSERDEKKLKKPRPSIKSKYGSLLRKKYGP